MAAFQDLTAQVHTIIRTTIGQYYVNQAVTRGVPAGIVIAHKSIKQDSGMPCRTRPIAVIGCATQTPSLHSRRQQAFAPSQNDKGALIVLPAYLVVLPLLVLVLRLRQSLHQFIHQAQDLVLGQLVW